MKTVVSLAFMVSSALFFSSATLAQKIADRATDQKVSTSAASLKSQSPGPKTLPNRGKGTSFNAVTGISDGRSTWLTWQMEAEVGNIGFNVYRINEKGAVDVLTPVRIVAGAAMRARETAKYGESYFFYDQTGNGTSAYYVETVGLDGSRLASHQIYPQYVPSLPAATGWTEEQMIGTMYRENKIEVAAPEFTKELRTEIESFQQTSDAATHRFVISRPGVARIGVKREGMYRVPASQLAAAGFDTLSDSTNWQLYVEGVEQAIIVGPGSSYIEFYGKGTDTAETDVRQYYLMNGSVPGKRIGEQVAHANTSTVVTRSFTQTFVKKEKTNYVEDIFNGDAENYFGRGIGSGAAGVTMTFNLTDVDFATVESSMHLRFQGYSASNHSIEIILNGETLAPTTGAGLESFAKNYTIPTSFLREGTNTIRFRAIDNAGDFVFFDTIAVTFNRAFVAQDNRLNFYSQNYRITQLRGFTTADVRVFDITRDGNPILLTNLTVQPNGATFGIDLPPARGRSLFAVADPALLPAVSVTPNNPELIGIPDTDVNLIIISYKDFMTQAETWAQYRRNQGFTVKVIEVSEIYDEYNFGTFSSQSIKDFLLYAYQNWQSLPGYVMLIGDASWDSRNYEGVGAFNMIPARMVATAYSETASDDALVDFDHDGLTEMAIGRIPVRNATALNTVYTKTVNWEAALTPNVLDRGALFAYDFNIGYTFDVMSQRLKQQLPVATPSTFVFRGEANANSNLLTAMNSGKYIVNYSGHGTAASWGGNPVFFNATSVPSMTESNTSIYTMLTCLNGYYHWLYANSIAEHLLLAPNRAAVAAWGSTGETLPNFQENMATRFYLKVGDGTIPRLGDLIRDAKIRVPGTDVRYSWALLGDPMLKVR